MQTNFLAAGVLRERLQEIRDAASYLQRLLHLDEAEREVLLAQYASEGCYTTFIDEVEKTLASLATHSRELSALLDSLQCEPLVYTGEGSTEEVMALLNHLLNLYRPASRQASQGGS